MVLSHMSPRLLLGCCHLLCRVWRALVDGQALWLLILAWDPGTLMLLTHSRLPPACGRPWLLGCFCERLPMGHNLICNPCGQEGLQKWMTQQGGDCGWRRSIGYWCPGPLADLPRVFLHLVSQKAGVGPGGGGFVARAARSGQE